MGKTNGDKLPAPDSKIAKYHTIVTTVKGITKKKAAEMAGYACPENVCDKLEKSVGFQVLKKTYSAAIQEHMTIDQIAREHVKVMTQDEQMGPKIAAIKMSIDKIEPEGSVTDEDERISVILK